METEWLEYSLDILLNYIKQIEPPSFLPQNPVFALS